MGNNGLLKDLLCWDWITECRSETIYECVCSGCLEKVRVANDNPRPYQWVWPEMSLWKLKAGWTMDVCSTHHSHTFYFFLYWSGQANHETTWIQYLECHFSSSCSFSIRPSAKKARNLAFSQFSGAMSTVAHVNIAMTDRIVLLCTEKQCYKHAAWCWFAIYDIILVCAITAGCSFLFSKLSWCVYIDYS